MNVTYPIRLEVKKAGNQASIRMIKGEEHGRVLRFILVEDNAPYTPGASDYFVFRAKKPDNTYVLSDAVKNGSEVTVTVPGAITQADGRVTCDLLCYSGTGTILFSPKIDIYVEGSLYDASVMQSSSDWSTLVSELNVIRNIQNTEAAREEAEAAREDAEEEREENEQEREEKLSAVNISVTSLPATSPATGSASFGSTGLSMSFGIPRGYDGKAFSVLGYYDTLSALQEAVPDPEPGDGYGVGTQAPFTYYIYDGVDSAWVSNGTGMIGPTGATGATGATGQNGEDGADGEDGTSAFWFTGTAVTGTAASAVVVVTGSKAGDMYLNTSTYNVYSAIAANTWKYECNIKGTTPTLPSWVTENKPSYIASEIAIEDDGGKYTASNVEGALEEVSTSVSNLNTNKAAKSTVLTGTFLASGWSGSTAPFTQQIAINGLTATTNAVIDYVHSINASTELARSARWSAIGYFESGAGTLTAICPKAKPNEDVQVKLIVIG